MFLITGATGLLGSHLAALCILNKIKVRCTKRKSSTLKQLLHILPYYGIDPQLIDQYLTWIDANLNDDTQLYSAMGDITTIFHCAADVGLGGVDAKAMYKTNVAGTERIFKIAKQAGVQHIIYVSSIATLGTTKSGELISEQTSITESGLRTPYAQTKYKAEQIAIKAADKTLKVSIINPGPILGPSCYNASSAKILFFAKRGIPFSTNGGTGYVDVRDVCQIMLKLAQSDISSQRFVVTGFNASNHELLSALMLKFHNRCPFVIPRWAIMTVATICEFSCAIFGKKIQLNRDFARTALNRSYYDNSKISKTLNYKFRPMSETVNDITTFMKRNKY